MRTRMEKIEQAALVGALSELTRSDMSDRPDEVLGLIRVATKRLRDAQ